MGVVVAIFLQSEELGLQRKELAETRSELKRSATAQEQNAAAMKKQENQQFLTARMSLLSAQLPAYDSAAQNSVNALKLFRNENLRNKAGRILQQISILTEEANFGFDGDGWDEHLEERAISQYLKRQLRDIFHTLSRPHNPRVLDGAVEEIRTEIDSLLDLIDGRQAVLTQQLSLIKDSLLSTMRPGPEGVILADETDYRKKISMAKQWIGSLLRSFPVPPPQEIDPRSDDGWQ